MGNYRNFRLVYYFVAQGTVRAEREKLEKDIRFFEKYMRVDKVYLEPYRSGVLADADRVELCREVFREHGIEPLYRRNGETVFEVRTQPGRYDLYRIVDFREEGGIGNSL